MSCTDDNTGASDVELDRQDTARLRSLTEDDVNATQRGRRNTRGETENDGLAFPNDPFHPVNDENNSLEDSINIAAEDRETIGLATGAFGGAFGGPEPIDVEEALTDVVRAQIKTAPAVFESESYYRPRYALLDADIFKRVMGEEGGLLEFNENVIGPSANRMLAESRSSSRTADIEDLERLGPRVSEAYRASNPEQAAILDELTRQAAARVESGRELSPGARRAAEQDVRAAYNDRGLLRSNPSIAAEILNLESARDNRQARARDFAAGVFGLREQTEGDPVNVVLGRPATDAGLAVSQQAFGGGFGGDTGQFNPSDPGALGILQGNQDVQANLYALGFQANEDRKNNIFNARIDSEISRRNRDAQLTSDIIGIFA